MDSETGQGVHRHKRRNILVVCLIVVAVLGGLGFYLYERLSRTPLDTLGKSVSFPLYYPKEMPRDYRLAASSIKLSSNIVLYKLESASKKTALNITLQPLPADFDAGKFAKKEVQPLLLPVGTLYDASQGKGKQYFITAKDGTLIALTALDKVDSELVNSLAMSLHRVK